MTAKNVWAHVISLVVLNQRKSNYWLLSYASICACWGFISLLCNFELWKWCISRNRYLMARYLQVILLICFNNIHVKITQCYCCRWLISFCICRLGIPLLYGVRKLLSVMSILWRLYSVASIRMTCFIWFRSSRQPVIDPSKPLPPQATFRGPYINTGSRDVGPDYQTHTKK